MNDFEKGVMYTVVQIIKHGDVSMSSYILRESGYANLDCSELDNDDKKYLRLLQIEKGIQLKLEGVLNERVKR